MTVIRETIIIVTILIVIQGCSGQTKTIQIANRDTSFWNHWKQTVLEQTKLSDLVKSKDELHFRFSSETQVVDVWTKDDKTFSGTFVNFTTPYNPDKYKSDVEKPEKFFITKEEIGAAKARQINKIFEELSVFTVPSQENIKGWGFGDDGITYTIEYSTPTHYSFKSYWTPEYYRNKIKEAATMSSLVNQLDNTLQMQKSFNAFIQTLPIGCYHAGSILVTCRETKSGK